MSLHYRLPRSLGRERLGFAGTAGDGASQRISLLIAFSLLPVTSSALVQALLGISASLLPHSMHFLLCLQSENALRGRGYPLRGAFRDSGQEPLFSVEILPWSLRGRGIWEEGTREKRHLPAPGRHRQQLGSTEHPGVWVS